MDAADVGRIALLGPVAKRDNPLGVAARRKGGLGVESVLNAPLGSADEGGQRVVALAGAHEVDYEAVVVTPVLHGRMQVEARPFVEPLAPRAALEVEGVLSGRGEGVRHADRAVVREHAGCGLLLVLRLEIKEDRSRGGGNGNTSSEEPKE